MTETASTTSLDTRELFVRALRRALRPIVRLMIRSGIRYDEFVDAARRAYVESAIRDADKDAPRPTRDQVVRQTGIRRELVDHYIDDDDPLAQDDVDISRVATELLHVWHTDSRYRGPSDNPLDLEFDGPNEPNFRSMTAEVCAQADPGATLELLIHGKAVAWVEGNRLHALSRFLIFPKAAISMFDYWGATLAHVIDTHAYNFNSRDANNKRLERSVFADHGLPAELLAEFHSVAQKRISQFLCDLDDWLGQTRYVKSDDTIPRVQIGVHAFFYVEDPQDPDATLQPSEHSPRLSDRNVTTMTRSDRTRSKVILALRRVLQSLARLLLRVGIRSDEFEVIVRRAHIECATHDFSSQRKPRRERIAILTGLSRNQVNLASNIEAPYTTGDSTLRPLLVEVLQKWHTAVGYGGPYGIPLELELSDPPDRCIRSLVEMAAPGADAEEILEELIRSGSVVRAGVKRYLPASRFFIMSDPASPALIEAFGMTVSRLSTTFEYNMDSRHDQKRYERCVDADRGLPAHLAPEFERYARTKATNFMIELDNWITAHSRGEPKVHRDQKRFDTGVNVCLYIESWPAVPEPLPSLVD